MQDALFTGMDASTLEPVARKERSSGAPRLRRPERKQMHMESMCLEDLLPADHRARLVWAIVEGLDLSAFMEPIAARGSDPGRPSTDPHLLVALWLYATAENIGSARRLARLCEEHDAYRWLCGGVSVNHHTLSDFRVGYGAALDDLLTQLIVTLVDQDIVTVIRLSQDSMRTRASANQSSFRRGQTLRKLLRKARAHVERLKKQADDDDDDRPPRRRAAQERAARERERRIRRALAVLPELEKVKENQTGKPSKHREARVSTTDPDARRMKRGDGSIGPAYSVQFATDTASRAVVGVRVVNTGSDQSQSEVMRQQVERRTGRRVKEHLIDGGYVKKELIESAEASGVCIYAPLPKGKDGKPCVSNRRDGPGVRAWRKRMQTAEAEKIYHERASTSETVNGEIKCFRALREFHVRGIAKAACAAIWSALAYNVVHFGWLLVPET